MKPCRSDTYLPLPAADEQGAFFADHGAESDYQGASRGGTGRRFIGFKRACCRIHHYCHIDNKSQWLMTGEPIPYDAEIAAQAQAAW
jgi:hypothetical protein